jgi:hypothetical protein
MTEGLFIALAILGVLLLLVKMEEAGQRMVRVYHAVMAMRRLTRIIKTEVIPSLRRLETTSIQAGDSLTEWWAIVQREATP